MVLVLLGGKVISDIHVNLTSTAEFTSKLNTCACAYVQIFYFYGQIYVQVETRIYTKIHGIFRRPPKGPQRAPLGSKDLPKTSSGDNFYIFQLPINLKATVTCIFSLCYVWNCVCVMCEIVSASRAVFSLCHVQCV